MANNKNNVIKLARNTKKIIGIISTLLILFFGWLKLKGVPIGFIVNTVSADVILKASLVIYFMSWISGTINDTDDQELVYAIAPNQGRFPWQGIILCALVATVFAVLCFVNSARHFSIVLAIFLLSDIFAWQYMIKKLLKDIIKDSRQEFVKNNEHTKVLKLDLVIKYLSGNWKWLRYAYGGLIVIIIIVMSYTELPQMMSQLYPAIPKDTYISFSIFFYVISFETWIWYMRIKSRIEQKTIDHVDQNYKLESK